MFRAIVIDQAGDEYQAELTQLDAEQLPQGDVTVRVSHSSMNYKDALAITGRSRIVQSFPMVPGIDLAGVVEESHDLRYKPGDRVIVNGWGLGERHWGGFSELASLRADWLIPLPDGLSERQAMAAGTAGYTAMLSLMALERHGTTPDDGDVVVTGASGGVGSFAIALLASSGYTVVASTGRPDEADYLRALGAATVIDRDELSSPSKPLVNERWAAGIDSVGSHTLANVCAATRAEGAVAACGMAQGLDFPATVAPFILRGVSLLGINSVTQPYERRVEAWHRLSEVMRHMDLDAVITEIPLEQVIATAPRLLRGEVRGRIVVDVRR